MEGRVMFYLKEPLDMENSDEPEFLVCSLGRQKGAVELASAPGEAGLPVSLC
ncbi:hypothetical protein D623_10031082 [Myotis brandtii]|uniref:Uncharacterized protein n=1 Tax=Myotis brandtii TaxID=109478 RepID=S7P5Q6_MYOBR|nr:hypothetical protein D623_10031082 [Myotis brandtii]